MALLFIVTLLFLWLVYELYWKRRNFPPGPTPLPFLGNLSLLQKYQPGHEAFEVLRKQYGPVFTFWFASQPMVMVCDYDIMKELFVKRWENFSERATLGRLGVIMRGGSYGIIDTNGDRWTTHRRFALHVLRDLGVGSNIAEQHILLETEDLLKSIEASAGDPTDIKKPLRKAAASTINVFLFGYRFSDDKTEQLEKIISLLGDLKQAQTSFLALLVSIFPVLMYFPGFRKLSDKLLLTFNFFSEFILKQSNLYKKEIDYESDEVKHYVEAYLKEQHKRELDGDFDSFSNHQLVNVCFDLWFAGFDTTFTTLQWSLIYVANNPDVQDKMREEMASVLPKDGMVTVADKAKLPYCQAVLNECQRLLNLLVINLFRKTNVDTEVAGQRIPAGATIVPQISCVLYDQELYPEPLKFNPSRFIDEHGKLKKSEELIPFSIGKRQCPGEGLARMELYLFLLNMVHQYKISGENLPLLANTMASMMNVPLENLTFTKV